MFSVVIKSFVLINVLLFGICIYPASFILFITCFSICVIISITNLTPEQKMRGFTLGGWIAKIIVWLPKYAIELGLLVQGLLGVRKYHKTSKDTIGLVQDEKK